MDVPAWARREIREAVTITLIELLDTWTPYVPPISLTDFRSQVDDAKRRLVDRIMEIIETEEEGPGGIYVLQIDNSSAHEGLLKITAIREDGENHRVTRLRRDVPGSEITILYSRKFSSRLAAEKIVHRRLKAYKQLDSSKYYSCDESQAIEAIQNAAREVR